MTHVQKIPLLTRHKTSKKVFVMVKVYIPTYLAWYAACHMNHALYNMLNIVCVQNIFHRYDREKQRATRLVRKVYSCLAKMQGTFEMWINFSIINQTGQPSQQQTQPMLSITDTNTHPLSDIDDTWSTLGKPSQKNAFLLDIVKKRPRPPTPHPVLDTREVTIVCPCM